MPLFPLGTALMPGALLPLQIFETRYVAMLRDLVDAQERRAPVFGVVAIRKGFEVGAQGVRALHTIGCSAQLQQAADLGEQRYLIVAQGRTRFRLGQMVEAPDTPYAVAEVQWLEDHDGEPGAVVELAGLLRAEISAYRKTIGEDSLPPPEDDRELSYWLPQAMEIDLSDRQFVLARDSTEARLRVCRQIVRREHTLTAALGTLGRRPDGPMNLN